MSDAWPVDSLDSAETPCFFRSELLATLCCCRGIRLAIVYSFCMLVRMSPSLLKLVVCWRTLWRKFYINRIFSKVCCFVLETKKAVISWRVTFFLPISSVPKYSANSRWQFRVAIWLIRESTCVVKKPVGHMYATRMRINTFLFVIKRKRDPNILRCYRSHSNFVQKCNNLLRIKFPYLLKFISLFRVDNTQTHFCQK